jgi:hypothetical protein
MKNTLVLASLCLAAAPAFAGSTAAPAPAPVAVTAAPASSAQALRPCLCHGAYAGSDAPFSFNLTASYDSIYSCRGMDMGENLWGGTATADYKLTDSLVWTGSFRYMSLSDPNGPSDFEELNAYTGLFYTTGPLTVGPSFRWYEFRPGSGSMNAYDLGLQGLLKVGSFDIHGGYFYETESEGSYAELGVSTTIPVADKISLVPSVEVSYSDGWVNPAVSGFNMIYLRLAAPISVTENVKVVPYIGGILPLEGLDDIGEENQLIGGVSVSVTF